MYGVEQVLTNQVRFEFPTGTLILPFTSSVTAEHKCGVKVGVSRHFYVAVTVTDHPAVRQVDLKIRSRSCNQPNFRFPAITIESIRRFTNCRMMCAVIDRIESGMLIVELGIQLIMDACNHIFSEITS